MSDKIHIRNLQQDILIGIHPEEKVNKQPVFVNITISAACDVAAASDEINDALDYSIIHDQIIEHMNTTQYDLIETLAEKLADICLAHELAQECKVCIDKPAALEFAESVAVEIVRKK